MNRIEDERIRFYLEHQARIREWAALEDEVQRFVHRFYRSLQHDLGATLRDGRISDDDVESFFAESDWPRVGLRRQSWPQDNEGPGVAMEWSRKKALFPPHGHLCFGVRWRAGFKSWPYDKSDHPGSPKGGGGWPAYRYFREAPKDKYWKGDNLKDYRKTLVEEILVAWNELAPLVDKAIGDPRT